MELAEVAARLPAGDAGVHVRVGEKQRAQPKAAPLERNCKLIFIVVFFRRFNAAIVRCLCLSLFHRLFGFSSLLGASFGAFFFLFVEDLLATQQFQESLVGAVALVPSSADDAGVAAVAVAET